MNVRVTPDAPKQRTVHYTGITSVVLHVHDGELVLADRTDAPVRLPLTHVISVSIDNDGGF